MSKNQEKPKLSAALRANLKRRKGQKQATRTLKSSSTRTDNGAEDRRDTA